jgi:hypothetical protein
LRRRTTPGHGFADGHGKAWTVARPWQLDHFSSAVRRGGPIIYLAESDGSAAGALLETVAVAGGFVETVIGGTLVSPGIPSCERMTARMA